MVNGAIEAGSLGLGSFLGGPSQWAKGKPVYTAADRIISAGVDLFGAGLSWARGYKVQDPSSGSYCPVMPRFEAPRGAGGALTYVAIYLATGTTAR